MEKDNSLEKYQKRRNFKKTPEPKEDIKTASSTRKKKDNLAFVIQEHHATHLHYDLRLEISGVLKSWAVPKGIPRTSKVKHLAVQTEDHPMSYKDFAGTIPEGEYGAGKVLIWDSGFYKNLKDIPMLQAWQEGKIEIEFHGNKVKGKFALIKMKTSAPKPSTTSKSPLWLLIKMQTK